MLETLDMITPAALAGFIGTTHYYRYLMGLVLTDGTHYLASHGAGWLLDIVASARLVPDVRRVPFEFWTLRVDKDTHRAPVTCTDGGEGSEERVLYSQDIDWTNFPLSELKLYVVDDAILGAKVALLTSEY
ncbi:MAG: DUF6876 family protein [Acetobacter sp.]|uniref:DUF6876 family protein n=1 Tax=Acetobacter sp. TaxID=440 RepID=UPI0039ED68EC